VTRSMLSPEEKKLAERILTAFKHYQCFIYEAEEHEKVVEVIGKLGVKDKVWIGYVDPRYPRIYIVKPKYADLPNKCLIQIENLFHKGNIRREDYLKRREELIKQCINH
jgi:hypothetical protein